MNSLKLSKDLRLRRTFSRNFLFPYRFLWFLSRAFFYLLHFIYQSYRVWVYREHSKEFSYFLIEIWGLFLPHMYSTSQERIIESYHRNFVSRNSQIRSHSITDSELCTDSVVVLIVRTTLPSILSFACHAPPLFVPSSHSSPFLEATEKGAHISRSIKFPCSFCATFLWQQRELANCVTCKWKWTIAGVHFAAPGSLSPCATFDPLLAWYFFGIKRGI